MSDHERDLQEEGCPHLFFVLGDTILDRIVCGGALTSPWGADFCAFRLCVAAGYVPIVSTSSGE